MLRDLQQAFATSLLQGNDAAAEVIRSGNLTAEKRLAIYRHNFFSTLRGALADIYPVVCRIVGDKFFAHLADQFIRATPSTSGDLNQFGSEFAEFLARHADVAELPYLGDTARMEWHWHRAFHAADHTPFDLSRLAAIDAARHGEIVFVLHPSFALLSSAYPLLRIWQVNQPDYEGDMRVDWEAGGDWLMIYRQDVEVVLKVVNFPLYAMLQSMEQRMTFAEVAAAALSIDEAFDLQGQLLVLVQAGVIVDARTDAVSLKI
jgi:hypothetical protein